MLFEVIMSYWTEDRKTKSSRLYVRNDIWLLYRYDCWSMDIMKWINGPPHMEEAMWYILLPIFMVIWMWMIIWA